METNDSSGVADAALQRTAAAARWLRGAAVTWTLSAAYLAVVVAVCFPVIVGTVTLAFRLWTFLSLDGVAGTLYFFGIGFLVFAEFTLLKPLMDAAGDLILRPEQTPTAPRH
ncbi:hypothetical protein [Halobaculum sp. D14]|uniref:hypothetical protein n=1 Tax=unclassified Halobaculum TaxID=2640896 RepID=UPI003EB74306